MNAPTFQDNRLDKLIADYLEAEETGRDFDTSGIPPEDRVEIARFVQSQRLLHRLVGPLRAVSASSGRDPDGLALGANDNLFTLPCRFGAYELLELLGQGGMGIVFKARQDSPRRLVAIKITRPELTTGSEFIRRFRNEAELAARLDHPGIVPLFEVGNADRRSYFTMKLLEGGDLGRHRDRLRHDPREIARLMIAVAQAVHHAHQRGVLHRDLKPSNILLDERGEVYVSDFGLARALPNDDLDATSPEMTRTGMLIGTPSYMAPEQLMGAKGMLTVATDVYGLGAVLYTLLTGQPPFRGHNSIETLMLARQGDLVPPRQIDPSVPRDLETICQKALARRPEDRYASAEDFANDLQRWYSGEPIVARAAGRIERAWRWCVRYPAIAGLSAVAIGLLLMLVTGLSIGNVMLHRERNRAIEQQQLAEQHKKRALASAREFRRNLYAAQINQAWRLWQAGDLWQVRRLLDQQVAAPGEEDLRGFEYYYLRNTCLKPREATAQLDAHAGHAYSAAYSPDGKLLATVGGDRNAVLWDSNSHSRLFTLAGEADDQNCVTFHPQGKFVVTGSEDGYLWTWDVKTGKRRFQIELSAPVYGVDFSPDGKLLAVAAGNGRVFVYMFPDRGQADFEKPRLSLSAHVRSAESVSFSSDGKMLASSGRDFTAKLWDVETGRCLHVLTHPKTVEIKCVAFAHKSPLVATASYSGVVTLWNAETGELQRELQRNHGYCQSVEFSPDDSHLAACYQSGGVCLWNLSAVETEVPFVGHGTRCWGLAYAPDGETLVSTDHLGRVLFWNPSLPNTVRTVFHTGQSPLNHQLLLDEGRKVALTSMQGSTWVIDAATGDIERLLIQTREGADRLACSADGRVLAVSYQYGTVRLWDLSSGECQQSIQAGATWLQNVVLLSDQDQVLTMSEADGLMVWDRNSGTQISSVLLQGSKALVVVAWGTTLATLHPQRQLAIWDLGKLDAPLQVLTVNVDTDIDCMALSTDEQVIAVSGVGVIDIWRRDGTPVRKILSGSIDHFRTMAFSPDGRTLATGSGFAPEIKLWHVNSGQELMTVSVGHIPGHLTFSPDGRSLFAIGGDKLFAFDAAVLGGRSSDMK